MSIYKSIDISKFDDKKRKVLARYELSITIIEFLGAVTFIIGSFLFLNEETTILGTWFFIIGSFFFACRPTLKMIRQYHMFRNEKY